MSERVTWQHLAAFWQHLAAFPVLAKLSSSNACHEGLFQLRVARVLMPLG
jgi:hypothetical protein